MKRARAPEVSIVIPCRDGEPTLRETLASVAAQTFAGWELVFVDDASRDASAAVARRFQAARPGKIRVLGHPGGAHRGAFASRLLGARRARAPVIALLDADDVWEPDYLRRHLERWRGLEGTGVALSYGPARYWFPETPARDFVHALASSSPQVFEPGEPLQNFLSTGYATVPRTSCSLIARDALLALAHLKPAARAAPLFEDQYLMWGLAMRGRVAMHPEAWARYRQRGPLDRRPKAYYRDTLRDERRFLPAIAGELRSILPGHPLLGPDGIDARMAALRGPNRASPFGDYFFERVPADLRALAGAR